MKVIFLDVDGELTYSGYSNPKTHSIDPLKVKLLAKIVNATGAKIVLSSSWKHAYNRETGKKLNMYTTLEDQLGLCGLEIFDITENIPGISLSTKPVSEYTVEDMLNLQFKYGTGRAAEVNCWILKNKPESFVILDDEDYEWEKYGLENNWIQPSWYDPNGGLHDEHVEKAIEILGKSN